MFTHVFQQAVPHQCAHHHVLAEKWSARAGALAEALHAHEPRPQLVECKTVWNATIGFSCRRQGGAYSRVLAEESRDHVRADLETMVEKRSSCGGYAF